MAKKRKKYPFERPLFYVVFNYDRSDCNMPNMQQAIINALKRAELADFAVAYEPRDDD